MDDPQLDEGLHIGALKGLQRINAVSRCWRAIWNPIRKLAQSSEQPISILDVACGGGDLLLKMSALAKRENLSIRFTGLDISPTAIEYASQAATANNFEIEFQQGNAAELKNGPQYDVVCCSLFLHHLPAKEAIELLSQMKVAARQMILVQDLLRTTTGYWLAWMVPKLLTRSGIVHEDGLRSVRAAFSLEEIHKLANAAGLETANIRKLWPQRFLLHWTRNQPDGTES